MKNPIPLIRLPAELKAEGYRPGTYWSMWNAAVLGRIPAEQQPNGRWMVDAADVPGIAATLGLARVPDAVAA